MTAQRRLFLDDDFFQSLDTVGANTNVVVTTALPYVVVPSGTIEDKVNISLQGAELLEVAYADLDILGNIGKFAMSVNSTVNLIVAKAAVDTEEKAKNYMRGLLAIYDMRTLEYNETNPYLYTLQTLTSEGVEIGSTNPSSLQKLVDRIANLDKNLNINDAGYYIHTVTHSLTVSA